MLMHYDVHLFHVTNDNYIVGINTLVHETVQCLQTPQILPTYLNV